MSALETLKKISYDNLEQFIEDINKNFAIVQNSPLYKGVPGTKGNPGTPGLKGSRGSKFLFVKPDIFFNIFINELQNSSQIDINYINNKLTTFQNKQKLFKAFNVSEFVDKDIVVLSNTLMIQYDITSDNFLSTGISFNESSTLLNTIQQQIHDYILQQLSSNQTLNNLKNIIENYETLGKNYADTNNTFVTSNLLDTSVYSPYIPGYNSNIGINIEKHKHFGFSDLMFPTENNGTFVFGSMKKYFNLLMNTVDINSNQTLTSDYAPGVNNIPSAVFLQDSENNGIMFGLKNQQNLKRFGSIYKNINNEVVIKSDSGKLQSESSKLRLHKDYLKFDKLGIFEDSMEISRNLSIFGDINNKYIKSGKYTSGASNQNNFNIGIVEFGRIGSVDYETMSKHIANYEMFVNYKSNVLVTNSDGLLSKDYKLENASLDSNELNDPNTLIQLTNTINNPKNILTSNYFGLLINRLNKISQYLIDNVWFKNQWNTGDIPSLKLKQNLFVEGNVDFSGNLIVDKTIPNRTTLKLGGYQQQIITSRINYQYFKDKVLITDSNGDLSNKYQLETNSLNNDDLLPNNLLTIFNESDFNILTTKYYAFLAKKLNSLNINLMGNYWTKNDFISGIIPSLVLNTGLQVRGGTTFIDSFGNIIFNINPITGELTLGSPGKQITFNSELIKFTNFADRVLYVKPDGTLSNEYKIELNDFNNNELNNFSTITNTIATGNENKSLARGYHIRWLVDKLNNMRNWLVDNVWFKNQWITGEIPQLKVGNFLSTAGAFLAGNPDNPDFYGDNKGVVFVGKYGGFTEIRGNTIRVENKRSKVLVTDSYGKIIDNELETLIPKSSNIFSNGGFGSGLNSTDIDIEKDYYDKTKTQDFLNIPSLSNKHITSNYFGWVVNHFKVIRKMLYDRPTYAEVGGTLPLGSIIYWNNSFGSIPTGWLICDGRWIPGINKRTPNLINKFIKGHSIPNTVGGNIDNNVLISVQNLPAHNHYMDGHTHGYKDTYWSERYGNNEGLIGSNGAGVDYDNGPNYQLDKTTNSGGAGYTRNTGENSPLNIEPHSVTLIPIMKYWDGIGTMPVITLPNWANIINIVNLRVTTSITIDVQLVDTTVKDLEVLGSIDNGVTWQSLKIFNNYVQTNSQGLPNAISLPSVGNWKIKLKALSGDSLGTNGEYSNIYDIYVFKNWLQITENLITYSDNIQTVPNKITFLTDLNDTSVTSGRFLISLDGEQTWSTLYDFTTSQIVNGRIYDIPLVLNNVNLSNKQTVSYKVIALNGNPTTNTYVGDEYSNTIRSNINTNNDPSIFTTLTRGYLIIDEKYSNTHFENFRTTLDIYYENTIPGNTTTLVNIEYLNNNNNWVNIASNINLNNFTYSVNTLLTNFRILGPTGYYIPITEGTFRLKAVNGNNIGKYSNEVFATNI